MPNIAFLNLMTIGGSGGATYTAKSIIVDIYDNWGASSYNTLRSIEFKLNGVLLTPTFTAYENASIDADHKADKVFDTTQSKTGSQDNTQWVKTVVYQESSRLICVFDTVQTFDEIIINNGHDSGANANFGSENCKIYTSTDTITSTVHDEIITNSTKIFDSIFVMHSAVDEIDDRNLDILIPNSTTVILDINNIGASLSLNADSLVVKAISSAWNQVTATLGRSTGKYYFEVLQTLGNTTTAGIGNGNESTSIKVGDTVNGYGLNNGGYIYHDGQIAVYITNVNEGYRYQIAVDLDAGYMWFAVGGIWKGVDSPDPATGTDPVCEGFTGTWYPATSIYSKNNINSIYFKLKDFQYMPPSGFLPWEEEDIILKNYTAKSIIFDIKNNWGSTSIGVRSIEFYLKSIFVSPLISAMTCYATTNYDANFQPEYAFDTTLSKMDSASGNGWLSEVNVATEQRLIVVFDTPLIFDNIVINNHHDSKYGSTNGIKDVKIYTSTDTITSTVYNEAIANSTLIYDSYVRPHIYLNIAAADIITLKQ